MQPGGGGVRRLHGDSPAQAGQVDRRALDSDATVDGAAAGVGEARLLAADATEMGPVQQVDDPDPSRPPSPGRQAAAPLPSRDRGPVRSRSATSTARSTAVSVRAGESSSDRVAVVVGVARRGHRTVAGHDPDVARRRPPPGPRHPSRQRPGSHRGLRPPRTWRVCLRLRAPTAPSRGRSSSRRSCRRTRRRPGRRRASARCAAGARPASEPDGSTSCFSSTCPVAVLSPTSSCAGFPLTSSSATTNTSARVSSITGVPVMPTLGVMLPHGSDPDGHGRAEVRRPDHGARRRRQAVDGVVLRGDEDLPTRHERLAVELTVQGGRRPGAGGEVDRGDGRGDAGPLRVAVVDGPRRRGRGGEGWSPLRPPASASRTPNRRR